MDKENVVYNILPFETTWMNLKSIKLNEIGQTEKDKYCNDIPHLYMKYKKEKEKKSHIHRHRVE